MLKPVKVAPIEEITEDWQLRAVALREAVSFNNGVVKTSHGLIDIASRFEQYLRNGSPR
jgi:hypothetical protein